MSKRVGVLSVLSIVLSIATSFGASHAPRVSMLRLGDVLAPDSSVAQLSDFGWRAHTNHVILAPEVAGALPLTPPAFPSPEESHPLRCAPCTACPRREGPAPSRSSVPTMIQLWRAIWGSSRAPTACPPVPLPMDVFARYTLPESSRFELRVGAGNQAGRRVGACHGAEC